MAAKIVNRGLQVIGGRASSTADAFDAIQTMAVDDSSTSFLTTHTDLGTPTNVVAVAFDSTPTRSSQTVTHIATFSSAQANFTIRRISLHNAASGSVTGSSTTLCAGIDAQSITKTSDFTMTITITIAYTDAS